MGFLYDLQYIRRPRGLHGVLGDSGVVVLPRMEFLCFWKVDGVLEALGFGVSTLEVQYKAVAEHKAVQTYLLVFVVRAVLPVT